MKILSLMFLIFLTWSGHDLYAGILPKTQNNLSNSTSAADFYKQITPELIYSYVDFNFDSTTGINFNRFQGHSNLYSVGADHMLFRRDLIVGLYLFKIDTAVDSQFLLSPGVLNTSEQSINNNTFFGHLLKTFNSRFYLDLAGAYGQNKINTVTQIAPDSDSEQTAFSSYINNNWFVSINALYRKPWKKLLLKTNVGALYSQINSGSYLFTLQSTGTSAIVAPLVNRATLILENAELGYAYNAELMPFINGGLIQVAQFSNSRPIVSAQINGSLPQLNMNKSGYRLGAGLAIKHKTLALRLEEKYYNAGGTFQSYQTLVGLEYQFS